MEEVDEAWRVVNLSSVTHHFAPSNERTHTADGYTNNKRLPLNNGIHDQHFWLGSALFYSQWSWTNVTEMGEYYLLLWIQDRYRVISGGMTLHVLNGYASWYIWLPNKMLIRLSLGLLEEYQRTRCISTVLATADETTLYNNQYAGHSVTESRLPLVDGSGGYKIAEVCGMFMRSWLSKLWVTSLDAYTERSLCRTLRFSTVAQSLIHHTDISVLAIWTRRLSSWCSNNVD